MGNYHLFAHMDRNYVKKGDKVFKYETPIGTVGTGNGQYYAHLHFSISQGLTVDELYKYIVGWSKEKVQQYYIDPRGVDFDQMFGRTVNVGGFGYDWLQKLSYNGYHPGVDVNGLGGGNTDFGFVFKSSCNGEVIYEKRTWFKNGGWGNLIVVEEEGSVEPPDDKCYYFKSQLRNEAKKDYWMGEDFDHTNPDHHIYLAEKMEDIRKGK